MSAPIIDETTGELLGTRHDEEDELETSDVEELRRLARAYRSKADGLATDVERLELNARNRERKMKALEDELTGQRQEDPDMQTARLIFNGWVRATGRNPKRAKFGAARQKAVLARLHEGHDAERVYRAATIGAQAANVSDRDAERLALLAALQLATGLLPDEEAKRVRAAYRDGLGKGTKFDDLELICRNEVNVERFAALADRIDPSGELTNPLPQGV